MAAILNSKSSQAKIRAAQDLVLVYIVNPENDREGIVERVGAFSEHPHVIAEPVKKPSMVKNVIGGFFTAMSGVQVYRAATDSFNQLALIVANRNFNGKDTRVSVTSRGDAAQLEPEKLIEESLVNILTAVGVAAAKPLLQALR